jgi:Peroxidase
MEIIDAAKAAVEAVCPGVVSCADILALAARDSSEYVNGPTWTVKLGRRDSTTANKDLASSDLPLTTATVGELIANFSKKGLNVTDMVALSGIYELKKYISRFKYWEILFVGMFTFNFIPIYIINLLAIITFQVRTQSVRLLVGLSGAVYTMIPTSIQALLCIGDALAHPTMLEVQTWHHLTPLHHTYLITGTTKI